MSGRVVSDIQTRAEGCISDTTQTLMLYIAYDTPTVHLNVHVYRQY